MRSLTLLTILIAAVCSANSELFCYVCDSCDTVDASTPVKACLPDEGTNVGTTLPPVVTTLKPVKTAVEATTTLKPSEPNKDEKSAYCYSMSVKRPATNLFVTKRGCVFAPENTDACTKLAADEKAEIVNCKTCHTDKCNGSAGLSMFLSAPVVIALIYVSKSIL